MLSRLLPASLCRSVYPASLWPQCIGLRSSNCPSSFVGCFIALPGGFARCLIQSSGRVYGEESGDANHASSSLVRIVDMHSRCCCDGGFVACTDSAPHFR